MDELRQSDLQRVHEQIGRKPTTPFRVTARCAPDGHPLVIRNAPIDVEGHPFPTLYWLTCPETGRAVATLESTGAIARWNERIGGDVELGEQVARAHERYAAERAVLAGGDDPADGGVGGTRTGVKCLHAHYAYHLAGGDDPVGAWVADHVEPVHAPPSDQRVAVIDMGTNSIRLLVADPAPDSPPTEIARDLVITRLGEGVDRSGVLGDAALTRTDEMLARFGRRARALHATRMRVGATSAVRDAANREDLAAQVQRWTHASLEVLTGEEEAALTFLGARAGLGDRAGVAPWLVIDIGGGSTEFVVGGPGEAAPAVALSTQMGSVRLTERFLASDPPTEAERAALRAAVVPILEDVRARLTEVPPPQTLIGVSGTVTTVQAIALGLPRDDPDAIHGTVLTRSTVCVVRDQLAAMTNDERNALAVMPRGRGDVIVAGAEILVEIMDALDWQELTVSVSDILDGLAVELLAGK